MTSRPKQRDPRLDFFRGIGMFIILIAHITDNPWTLWIPARFGFFSNSPSIWDGRTFTMANSEATKKPFSNKRNVIPIR